MKAAVKITKLIVSPVFVKASKGQVKINISRIVPYTTLVDPDPELKIYITSIRNSYLNRSSFGNPCLDLYYKVDGNTEATQTYLKQVLPLAWSHNSLTTLKLICNLADFHGKDGEELFYTAAIWLHQNHPKTLACNVEAIAGDQGFRVSYLWDFVEILYRLLLLPEAEEAESVSGGWRQNAVDKCERDPNYKLLHDRVSDIYADYLKSDIEKLDKTEKQHQHRDVFSSAADCCPFLDDDHRASTLLCESIARKVFPRDQTCLDENEADYTRRVRDRLIKEVLVPVRKTENRNGPPGNSKVKQYLEDLKAGRCEIKLEFDATDVVGEDDMLPHNILSYVNDPDVGDAVEVHWKAMVEHLSNKGKLKNCLAVCDFSGYFNAKTGELSDYFNAQTRDRAVALGLLLSELSEEPWKDNAIAFTPDPCKLHEIGGHDLKSKCASLRSMKCSTIGCSFESVFDLVLQEAVNRNLKPEQMIKKVFVFSNFDFHVSSLDGVWVSVYERIRRKFEKKGYGDAVPRIVFWGMKNWGLGNSLCAVVEAELVAGGFAFRGFSNKFLNLFLENEGEVGPDQAMEAGICGEMYQDLVVVD